MKAKYLAVLNVKSELRRAALVCSIVLLAATALVGQSVQSRTGLGEDSSDKWQSGEVGYTIGCSFAASLGIVVCGELPSGKQAENQQATNNANAAIAKTQALATEAADVSTAISQATDPEGSSDLSNDAALAARDDLQDAADGVVESTPDVFTVAQPYTTEPSQDKVPAYTEGQRILAWGVEHIPAQETQNTPPQVTSLDEAPSSGAAAQPNYQDSMRQYYAAVQRYQQAQQNFANVIANTAARAPVTTKYVPVPAPGPQVRGTRQATVPYNGPWFGVH
jgi:hypothetical protein